MEKIPCTVGILTFNSDKTLRRALESVKDFDDIVINDGGSTDDTLEIARAYGARVIRQEPSFQNINGALKDYAGVRNQCLEATRYDWFFYIDSDEEVTPELVEEIRRIVASPAPAFLVYNISPRIMLDGRCIDYSSNYPGWQKRFFNKGLGALFRKAVHERITYDESAYPAGYLKGHWLYEISSQEDVEKTEKYARMDARLYQTRTWSEFVVFATKKIGTILKILAKSLVHSSIHWRSAMPLALEWRRISYQVQLLHFMFLGHFNKRV